MLTVLEFFVVTSIYATFFDYLSKRFNDFKGFYMAIKHLSISNFYPWSSAILHHHTHAQKTERLLAHAPFNAFMTASVCVCVSTTTTTNYPLQVSDFRSLTALTIFLCHLVFYWHCKSSEFKSMRFAAGSCCNNQSFRWPANACGDTVMLIHWFLLFLLTI